MALKKSTSFATSTIASILSKKICPNEPIKVNGWIKTCRSQKFNTFIHLSDGTSEPALQVVVNESLSNLPIGSAVQIEGFLKNSPPNLKQSLELHTTKEQISMLNACDASYPFQKKSHGIQFLRDYQHLRPKTSDFANMLRTRHHLTHAFHDFCKRHEIMYIHTPVLTSSQCETGGEVFKVESAQAKESDPFFQLSSYLTVSSQLHLELFTNAHPRVYTLSPCFRAEQSQSTRHLAEFHMLELEFAFLDSLPLLCSILNEMLVDVIQTLEATPNVTLSSDRTSILLRPFQFIEYKEAVAYFSKKGIDTNRGLSSEMEKQLAEDLNAAVFILRYPKQGRPFYMKHSVDQDTVENFDFILPHVGEVAGGSLRENHLQRLTDRMIQLGLPLPLYQWYLDTRKFGSPEHGGFGLGFDRLILYLLGKENIKDCIGIPRIFKECKY